MNFMDVQVSLVGDRAILTVGTHAITLEGDCARALAPYDGKVVVMGVRPEDVHEAGTTEGLRLSEPFSATWLPSSRIRAANLCRAPVAQSVPQGEGVERGWAA